MSTSAPTDTVPSGTPPDYTELAAVLRGTLILPGDAGYDEARAVYNAMIDRRPAAIVRCADQADVVAAVNFGRNHGLALAVRGGGHNAGGLGIADGALVVDLSPMRSTTVDPAARTVRVDGGCTWSDVDHATDAERHPDLFWAIRGGGGNFGVVTSFTFRLHEVGENGSVIAGPVFYDLEDAPDVLRWYRDLLPTLPEELGGWFALLTIPDGPPFPEELRNREACAVVWCYTGDHARADEAIDVHLKYGRTLPTPQSSLHLYPIDGAAARVPADATAFAYRNGGWAGMIVGVSPDPADKEAIAAWARDYWKELHPTSAGGAYINFMMEDEGTDRVRASYLGNYDRLARAKAEYDPNNLFHINQNIPPAS